MEDGTGAAARVDELVRKLDRAVAAPETAAKCENVKNVLRDLCSGEDQFLDERLLDPVKGVEYARRLLHADPAGRYTIVVMAWDSGQETSVHDHAGIWCVECVYRGRIQVTSYDVKKRDDDLYDIETVEDVRAGVGEAGMLIPPFEFHKIQNPYEELASTIHVYGGHLTWCHKFLPADNGGYARVHHEFRLND